MKNYSIKTIDGNRYDFNLDEDFTTPVDQLSRGQHVIEIVDDSSDCVRYFNAINIVSIKVSYL